MVNNQNINTFSKSTDKYGKWLKKWSFGPSDY